MNINEIIASEVKRFVDNSFNKKLYYHGRNPGNRPFRGNYIFITDNLGYASGYSDGKELYTYTIPFSETKLFSIKNKSNLKLLSSKLQPEVIQAIIRDSGLHNEIDWAALSYISTDEFPESEDLFIHLGFLGIRLNERQGIESIYIFDQDNLKFMGKVNIDTPEMQKKIGWFYADFQKDKNFLEQANPSNQSLNPVVESLNQSLIESEFNKTIFTDLPQDLFDKLKLRKFSDNANRSHMKLFKAKDGREYIIYNTINTDIFRANTIDGQNIGVAVFDEHQQYFSGYEVSQSIKVLPEYQRLGIASALTDFAENIYGKPYKPTKLLSEPMQGFVKNRFAE